MKEKRADSPLRPIDESLSNQIYSFLDETFYKTEVANFERVTDKERQIKGIDVIFDINDEHYAADEKAAIRYRNLHSFTLELSFINKNNEVQEGWFVKEGQDNNSYVFIWIDRDREDLKKETVTLAVVLKEKLQGYLDTLGWTRERLLRKMEAIRNGTDTEKPVFGDPAKFVFSKKFVEAPINLLLPRRLYMELADHTWTGELN